MPTYTYMCDKCGKTVDRVASVALRDEQYCECDPSVKLKRQEVYSVNSNGFTSAKLEETRQRYLAEGRLRYVGDMPEGTPGHADRIRKLKKQDFVPKRFH